MMPAAKAIQSLQNPTVKYLLKLQEKSAFRKTENKFVVEGVREIQLALKGNYHIEKLLFCPHLAGDAIIKIRNSLPKALGLEVSLGVYQKLAYRDSTEGVMALVASKNTHLDTLVFKTKTPLVLVIESPEKPGNLGAILRTADAAQVDAVIVADPRTDWFNPNVIRSSVGTVFTNQLAAASTEDIIAFLKHKQIKIFAAELNASKNYHEQDFTGASAIVLGTEATGLTAPWLKAADQNIIIPMRGKIDSLNLAISASILVFEAKRQRGFAWV